MRSVSFSLPYICLVPLFLARFLMLPDSVPVHPGPFGGASTFRPEETGIRQLPMMPFHLQVHERSQNFAGIQPSRFCAFVVRPDTALP